jgi:hypothetical protein
MPRETSTKTAVQEFHLLIQSQHPPKQWILWGGTGTVVLNKGHKNLGQMAEKGVWGFDL